MTASFYATLAMWVGFSIAIAATLTYLLRPRTRARYPGGKRRYLLAVIVQAAGFMIPIPFVLIALIGQPIFPGLDVLLAAGAGVLSLVALRFLPFTGPLLADLQRTRLEVALERQRPYSRPQDSSS